MKRPTIKEYRELIAYSDKRYRTIEDRTCIIGECLTGGARLLARVPGQYSDESHWVYVMRESGRLVIQDLPSGSVSVYESICDALDLYRMLQAPANQRICAVLESKQSEVAA